MFTGIIASQGVLREKKKFQAEIRLTFEILGKSLALRKGESVAVDGVCLTVAAFRGKRFSADLIPETLRSTTLGSHSVGQRVNLERPLRMGDALGGHWVTGHVDGVGWIRGLKRRGENLRLQIEAPVDIMRPLVYKGSVAVDGISFTLQEIGARSFVVGVTPHTLRVTTLQGRRVGDSVNLEVDFFAKLVEHFVAAKGPPSLKKEDLLRQGF